MPNDLPSRRRSLPEASARTFVLVVSATRLVRDGLAELLARDRAAQLVRVAGSGDDAIATVRSGPATIVLLDAATPDAAGIARRLTPEPAVRGVIAFAVADDVPSRVALAECGVCGYVSHDGSLAELLATTDAALHGELHCDPSLAAALARRLASMRSERLDRVSALSHRERDVVRLVDEGMSNKEIAHRLHIELATVKNHMHHILHKLGVQRRGEAAAALRRWRSAASA
ncbi:MAG: response regulator transcription factor [Gemmatimonadetes bacterium]|nr:response regulator transcription factor [Gemmatimonadota bacterium]MCC6771763.1 response regulator transcription factor [Gemmatimonadaceae bacterium]